MKPAIQVSYHVVLNAGPHTDTSDASDLSLESHGRIRWQMKNCSESQTLVTLFKTEADNTPLSRTCQQDAKTSHFTHYTADLLSGLSSDSKTFLNVDSWYESSVLDRDLKTPWSVAIQYSQKNKNRWTDEPEETQELSSSTGEIDDLTRHCR